MLQKLRHSHRLFFDGRIVLQHRKLQHTARKLRRAAAFKQDAVQRFGLFFGRKMYAAHGFGPTAHGGQRGAQLVRHVFQKPLALIGHRLQLPHLALHRVGHAIERRGQLAEFIPAGHRRPGRKPPAAQRPGSRGHFFQRLIHPAQKRIQHRRIHHRRHAARQAQKLQDLLPLAVKGLHIGAVHHHDLPQAFRKRRRNKQPPARRGGIHQPHSLAGLHQKLLPLGLRNARLRKAAVSLLAVFIYFQRRMMGLVLPAIHAPQCGQSVAAAAFQRGNIFGQLLDHGGLIVQVGAQLGLIALLFSPKVHRAAHHGKAHQKRPP